MTRPVDTHGGISRHGPTGRLARHRHTAPYAALVLSGSYTEAGDLGRHKVSAGDIIIHGRFDAHQDRFETRGAQVLNLPVGADAVPRVGRVSDPDMIARIAEIDLDAAARMTLTMAMPGAIECVDWPDLLAAALREDRVGSLDRWAFETGIARTSLSRGFTLAYGVSPQRYRAEHRARRAAEALLDTTQPLAAIASDLGFADQAHMTRAVARLTGISPARLRRGTAENHVTCVQDGSPSPR